MQRAIVLLALALPGISHAIEPYQCRGGAFASYEGLAPGEIVAAKDEPVHFRNDMKNCPQDASCAIKSYLVDGDLVVTAHPQDGWVCVYYTGKKSNFTGWMPQENVKILPVDSSPQPQDWLGYWASTGEYKRLTITAREDGTLLVVGKANWVGGNDSEGKAIVHFGGVTGAAAPVGNHLAIADGDDSRSCRVNLQLLGTFLLSTDNNKCGGLNVRFMDVMRRKP